MREFRPIYRKWRHGGWYVSNLHRKDGGCGCVSNNYPDKKWRIVCEKGVRSLSDYATYPTRHAAAMAEYVKYGVPVK